MDVPDRRQWEWAEPDSRRALPSLLLLLLTLGLSLLALLTRRLGVLLGGGRVLFALRVITFSMLFGRSTMRFGRIFVMLGSLIVFVLRHGKVALLGRTDRPERHLRPHHGPHFTHDDRG
jgi:hypothetical protein